MSSRAKVFCIGFHKTGTTSLFAALSMLGYRTVGTVAHRWPAEKLAADGAAFCIDVMKNYDACEDMPWPHFFRELDDAYPGSKFILTLRDSENWFRSIDAHFGHKETELNAFAYGREYSRAHDNKARWMKTHERHIADVRAHFKSRPDDLLEVSLEEGDGWEALCPFLGAPIPDVPFPVKNTAKRRQSLAYRLKRKLWLMAGRTPHPERLL